MGRKRHTPEQIITALREAEVGLARGKSVKLMSREPGITEQTYYRWRREYGGMKVSQARRLKELERENGRCSIRPTDTSGSTTDEGVGNATMYFGETPKKMFEAPAAGLPNEVDLEREIAAAAGEPAPTKPALPPRFTRKSTGWK